MLENSSWLLHRCCCCLHRPNVVLGEVKRLLRRRWGNSSCFMSDNRQELADLPHQDVNKGQRGWIGSASKNVRGGVFDYAAVRAHGGNYPPQPWPDTTAVVFKSQSTAGRVRNGAFWGVKRLSCLSEEGEPQWFYAAIALETARVCKVFNVRLNAATGG